MPAKSILWTYIGDASAKSKTLGSGSVRVRIVGANFFKTVVPLSPLLSPFLFFRNTVAVAVAVAVAIESSRNVLPGMLGLKGLRLVVCGVCVVL